jgi:hypothetical protein
MSFMSIIDPPCSPSPGERGKEEGEGRGDGEREGGRETYIYI